MFTKLRINLFDNDFVFAVTKVDRTKLYGERKIEAKTPDGNDCQKAYTDESGTITLVNGCSKFFDVEHEPSYYCHSEKSDPFSKVSDSTGTLHIRKMEVNYIDFLFETTVLDVYKLDFYEDDDKTKAQSLPDGIYEVYSDSKHIRGWEILVNPQKSVFLIRYEKVYPSSFNEEITEKLPLDDAFDEEIDFEDLWI